MMKQIQIFEDITQELLMRISKELEDAPDGSELELQLASYGGELLVAISIIDLIRSKSLKTTANIVGFVASAASIIALSCDTVNISPLGSMMIHSAWAEAMDSDDPGIKRCNEIQMQIIHKRCPDMSVEQIRSKDLWFDPETCLRLNLVDNIYNNRDSMLDASGKIMARLGGKESMPKRIKSLETNVSMKPEEQIMEEVKEEVREETLEQAEEMTPETECPKDASLVDVVEKLSERLTDMEARIKALEEGLKDPEVADKEQTVPEAECEDKERINALFKSLSVPQAKLGNAPKAIKQVKKVDYKKYSSFIND